MTVPDANDSDAVRAWLKADVMLDYPTGRLILAFLIRAETAEALVHRARHMLILDFNGEEVDDFEEAAWLKETKNVGGDCDCQSGVERAPLVELLTDTPGVPRAECEHTWEKGSNEYVLRGLKTDIGWTSYDYCPKCHFLREGVL